MKARASMSHRMGLSASGLGLLSTLLLLFTSTVAHGQPNDAQAKPAAADADEDEEEEEEESEADAKKPAAGASASGSVDVGATTAAKAAPAATDTETVYQSDDQLEQPNGFVRPPSEALMQWHGGLEADSTYARYSEDGPTRPQGFADMRGRFVVGPTLEYRFGEHKDWFVAARGELVAWLRETNTYQVNADDVYGQVGKKGVWDLKLGRFQTWRVYHKGAGFDLYTIEDQGACASTSLTTGSCSLESGVFGPHTYEVNYNYYRESAGHVALHAYPTPWSGVELAGAFGNAGALNQLGARAAGLVHFDFLRVSAAAEYRMSKPGQEQASMDPVTGVAVICANCQVQRNYGFGGGVEVTLKPVEVGLNGAQSHETKYSSANGTLDQDASNTRTSLGGYAQFDVGSLAFDRSLVLGFGLNRTEVVDQVNNFEQHYQGAAYAVFPLGFNAASLKLVVSQATLDIEKANGDGSATQLPTSTMRAARLRFSYPF
jgi:hypothetical protein